MEKKEYWTIIMGLVSGLSIVGFSLLFLLVL